MKKMVKNAQMVDFLSKHFFKNAQNQFVSNERGFI